MPFREKLKKTFLRRSSTTPKPDKPAAANGPAAAKANALADRRRTAAVHQAKLERFSWSASWRRISSTSQYSPRGSRVHSRQTSATAVPTLSATDEVETNGAGEPGRVDEAAGPAEARGAAGERPMFLEPRWKAAAEKKEGGGGAFSQRELDEAVKRGEQRAAAA